MMFVASRTAVFLGTPPTSTFACSPLPTTTEPCRFESSTSPSSIVSVVVPFAATRTTNSVPRIAPFAAGVSIRISRDFSRLKK